MTLRTFTMLGNTFTEVPDQGIQNWFQFRQTCSGCREEFVLLATEQEVDKYLHGAFAQEAFPKWTADERELLISGMCGKCFDELIPEE